MTRLPVLALAAFVVGAVLMVALEHTITRVLGLALLFFAIVAGVFAIATPELLGEDAESGADERQHQH